MIWLTEFLTGLLSDIIRPIIKEELEALRLVIADSIERKKSYKKHDNEASILESEMAAANTSEERYAILQKIKNSRATLNY